MFELRLAGSGGQGIILASIILAEAALSDSLFVSQSQSYGPEARGGQCKADVVMSEIEIDYPMVEMADCLVALTRESLDNYSHIVRDGGVIIADSSLDYSPYEAGRKVAPVAILKTSSETVGSTLMASIVALGVLHASMNIVTEASLEAAVLKYVPEGSEGINIRALKEGISLGKSL